MDLDPNMSYLGDSLARYISFVPGAPMVINATEAGLPVLVVESLPVGVNIAGSNGRGGYANYSVMCDADEQVTLTADSAVVVGGAHYNFVRWIVDGQPQPDLQTEIMVTMGGNHTVKALYNIVAWMLTVQSTPAGVYIMGSRPGKTDYSVSCDDAEAANLTATILALVSGQTYGFVRWTGAWVIDGQEQPAGQAVVSFTVSTDRTAVAVYFRARLSVTSAPYSGIYLAGSPGGTTP